MRASGGAVVILLSLLTGAAAGPEACDIPDYFINDANNLRRTYAAVTQAHTLTVAVVGTGSSILAGPDGPRSAYPARLEAALRSKLPQAGVKVVTLVRTRLTAEDLAHGMGKLLVDEKPDLVIWQTGTIDAIRRVEPDDFRAALEQGVETLQNGGADVILMNMQYSPRTESMIALGPYADVMRVVAQQYEVPLFDRLGIMHHWSDTGEFDLYATDKDNVLAQRVHDCIGRGLAAMIVDAAHLREPKPEGQ